MDRVMPSFESTDVSPVREFLLNVSRILPRLELRKRIPDSTEELLDHDIVGSTIFSSFPRKHRLCSLMQNKELEN